MQPNKHWTSKNSSKSYTWNVPVSREGMHADEYKQISKLNIQTHQMEYSLCKKIFKQL